MSIIWGDGKTHFLGIFVDLNRENHLFNDGMVSLRMVIFKHNKSLPSIATFGGPLNCGMSTRQNRPSKYLTNHHFDKASHWFDKFGFFLLPQCTGSNDVFILSNAKRY